MTMNDTWGFKSDDHNWKSAQQLIRNLIDIASKGGNYLLNVGPTSEGEMPAASVERLREIGAWMDRNGESIYQTSASPFLRLPWGRATQKPGRLYLNVFDWPPDGTLVVPMHNAASKAYVLGAAATPLAMATSDNGLSIQLPKLPPDPISSVVVLEGVGPIDPLPPPPLQVDAEGKLELDCDAGDLIGSGVRIEGNLQLNITDWRSTADGIQWQVRFDQPGTYQVALVCAVPVADAGSEFVLTIGARQLQGKTTATASFQRVVVGTIQIERAESATIALKAASIAHQDFMKLRAVQLQCLP